ncbi:transposase [bacterium]|nr:transposase [bacterium]
MAYFITFRCYGTLLHGEEGGRAVDRHQRSRGYPTLPANTSFETFSRSSMVDAPYRLNRERAEIVLRAVLEVCAHRHWFLTAVHVRETHVHVVVSAEQSPERVMNTFKAYASRHLNATNLDEPARKRWARHGSTRWLNGRDQFLLAVHYVVHEQGEPMAVYLAEDWQI